MSASARTPAQWFCLIGGGFLVARGIVGLILDPAFEAPGEGWHQLFHTTSGVALLLASRVAGHALALTLSFGAVYALVAVAGIIDGGDVAGVIPIATSDNVVHTVLTLAALGAGGLALARRDRPVSPAT